MSARFADRAEAGRKLGERLEGRFAEVPVVLALPRGGVPVAAEIARTLGAPLDLVLVRKLGAPGQPELAVGAVVDGDPPERIVNEEVRLALGIGDAELDAIEAREIETIAERRRRYLAGRGRVPLAGRHVILVDDGIATGATVRAAIRAVRRAGPAGITVATPVAPPDATELLRAEADAVVVLNDPDWFMGISEFYEDFHQLDDAEVAALLRGLSDDRS